LLPLQPLLGAVSLILLGVALWRGCARAGSRKPSPRRLLRLRETPAWPVLGHR
jgi:hypothetical protein